MRPAKGSTEPRSPLWAVCLTYLTRKGERRAVTLASARTPRGAVVKAKRRTARKLRRAVDFTEQRAHRIRSGA
jgi:hypothetical protein